MPRIRMMGWEGAAELRCCAGAQGSHISATISSTKPRVLGSSETTCCKTCFQDTDIVVVFVACALTDFLPPQVGSLSLFDSVAHC